MDEGTRSIIIQSLWRVAVFSLTSFITIKILMKHMDPTNKRKDAAAKKANELLRRLGIKSPSNLTEYELMIASHLVDPESVGVSWENIGGLGDTISELKETVIMPIKRRDLFANSQLTKPPKGVLLHGPPGCGKTMIAKATAQEAGCNFINLDLSILTDKWYGESQKLASAVFSLAHKIQPCIIFIDEIDSFLRNRNVQDHEATAMMKAQFMTLWDGLDTDPQTTVIVMGATNRPHDLDQAIRRRMPATFHIKLPGLSQREDILRLIMRGEPIADNVNLRQIAVETDGFSGSDLRELCRSSAIYRVRDFVRSCEATKRPSTLSQKVGDMNLSEDQEEFVDTIRPITMEDLLKTLRKMKEAKVTQSAFH